MRRELYPGLSELLRPLAEPDAPLSPELFRQLSDGLSRARTDAELCWALDSLFVVACRLDKSGRAALGRELIKLARPLHQRMLKERSEQATERAAQSSQRLQRNTRRLRASSQADGTPSWSLASVLALPRRA